ncbi:MAG: DUF484 family protein [Methylococcaceae bacterium]|nr:DUF484 family protein [Methylococcaceae bacterium]
MTEQIALNAEDVVSYLQQHPDFFSEHLELLETLTIPHPIHGNTVSLIAKQLEIFRTKHQQFENQLTTLIDIAKDNDTTSSRLHELTLALLNASTLEMAVKNLHQVLTECFFTDFVVLKIIGETENTELSPFFLAADDKHLQGFSEEFAAKQPRCGHLEEPQKQFLFEEAAAEVKSCAIIPILYPNLSALLVIASRDENRFHSSMGNLFLTQISEIVGTRLVALLAD